MSNKNQDIEKKELSLDWDEEIKRKSIDAYTFIRRQLLTKSPFYAVLVMQLQPRIATPLHVINGCWCAGTDGRYFYINPDGWLSLTPLQQVWVIKHEVLHCVLRHPTRLHTRNRAYWNIACDYVVNLVITQRIEDLPLEGVLWDEKYKEMDADTIYQLIKEEQQKKPNQSQKNKPGNKNGNNKSNDQNPGNQPSQGFGNKDESNNGKKSQEAEEFRRIAKSLGADPHSTMQDPFIDPETGEATNPEDIEHYKTQIENTWRAAFTNARQIASMKGDYPAGIEQLVERENTPRLPWERLLQQWVQARVREGYDWMRPNKRFLADGLYLPGRGKPALGDVVIIVDTSGSVNNKLLAAFLGEVEGVLKAHPARVFLVACDADASLVGIYENAYDFPTEVPICGRGGTDFRTGVQWIEDHSGSFCEGEQLMDETPSIAIYLTDGMGDYPNELPEGMDMLWILSQNHPQGSPWYPQVGDAIVAFEDLD